MYNTIFYDRDTPYWNDYYSKDLASHNHSLFAEYVGKEYLSKKTGRLLELGCGNGRDSLFFLKYGVDITAIDAAQNAIEQLNENRDYSSNCKFLCGDFVDYKSDLKYTYCYSRFSLHAISGQQQSKLIEGIYNILECGGYFFIECRSVNDDLYGMGNCVGEDEFLYDGHYRRFIRIEQLITELVHNGFKIEYAAERRDFAPYRNENPPIIRVIGRKE